MEYSEVLQFIGGTKKFGAKAGLEKPRRLMELLGNPQDSLRFVHIAGTNGKGSTAAFLSEILVRSGYKTGLFTSPFLYEFNERMRINGENISDEALCRVIDRVKRAADQMEADGGEYPTEFELVTAAAFCYFAEEQCDIVVLEVGLGGRFDATNIIKTPLVSVITSLSLDHTQYLGDTIRQIAVEKCGIIKENGVTVCYGEQKPEALKVISKATKERKNRLVVCDFGALSDCSISVRGNDFTYRGRTYHTALCGEYQIYNAVTAIAVAEELRCSGFAISDATISEGLCAARWSGRLEMLSENPLIIADGSHNPDGMRAFAQTVGQLAEGRKTVCVVGMMKDKDCAEVLCELSNATRTVVMTTVDNPRSASAVELAAMAAGRFDEIDFKEDNKEALHRATELAGENGVVFVVGSLYLIDGARKAILNQKTESQ